MLTTLCYEVVVLGKTSNFCPYLRCPFCIVIDIFPDGFLSNQIVVVLSHLLFAAVSGRAYILI